jgi:hypothetical protein
MSVFLEGEEQALLTVVNACVVLSPMTVEDAASVVFLLAAFARHGGKVSDIENLLKRHVGEERYADMFQEMTDAFKQYMNNRTVELDTGRAKLGEGG